MTIPNVDKNADKLDLAYISDWRAKWQRHYGEAWQFLIKLNIFSPYDPAFTLIDIFPRNVKPICKYEYLNFTAIFLISQ